jgi:pyruvate formate lyase activating enzyme
VIFNVMRFSTHDGPGIRTTVFFNGCPLACWWCHNPESQSLRPSAMYSAARCRHCGDCIAACPESAIEEVDGVLRTSESCQRCGACAEACQADARQLAGRHISLADLLSGIERDLVFFEQSGGGVTLSGGEPLAQPRFTRALLAALSARGIHTAVETCGYAHAEVFASIAPLARLLLFDLKVVDSDKHKLYTGVENVPILANLARAAGMGMPVRVRIPLVPGINDSPSDARQFAACLSDLRLPDVDLLPYHRTAEDKYHRLGWNYRLADTPEPSPGDIARFAAVLADAGLRVNTGG